MRAIQAVAFSILFFATAGCGGLEDSSILEDPIDEVEAELLPRQEAYQDTLELLYNLGIYGFDSVDFEDCRGEDLQSFYSRRQIPNSLMQPVQRKFEDVSGDEIFEYLIDLPGSDEDEVSDYFEISDNTTAGKKIYTTDQEDNLVMHLIWLAAERGNVDAMNEIGAAQTYCYQGVEQDIDSAVSYLEKAVNQGDFMASMTLGKIYYTGLGGHENKTRGKELRELAVDGAIEQLQKSRVIPDEG